MSECTHDCSTCGESCASREPQSLLKAHHPEAHVGKVYGIVSGKGGVGKSMVTSQLAVAMRRRGYNVGIMDADITGPSIPKAFGIHDHARGYENTLLPVESKTGIQVMSINLLLENETDPVIWRGPVISGVVQQFWTEVLWNCDYLFVDMPPGTGDVSLSVFQSIPLDGIIIVASPQELVSMVVEKAVRMAEMMEVPIVGLVENMSYVACPDCGRPTSCPCWRKCPSTRLWRRWWTPVTSSPLRATGSRAWPTGWRTNDCPAPRRKNAARCLFRLRRVFPPRTYL